MNLSQKHLPTYLLCFSLFSEFADKKQQSIIVLINFGNHSETINLKEAFKDLPDSFTVEITGQSSKFKNGEQKIISAEFELGKFESVVGVYNDSITLLATKATMIMLVAGLIFNNFRF